MIFVIFTFLLTKQSTTEIYTLSLHDALPISDWYVVSSTHTVGITSSDGSATLPANAALAGGDRKSTRLNSSHRCISYAVFCLKKKTYSPQTVGFAFALFLTLFYMSSRLSCNI